MLALQKSVTDVDLQLAYFTRTSTVQFTPDPLADLMFNGVATNVFRGSVVNGVQGDSAFRLNEAHTVSAGRFRQRGEDDCLQFLAASADRRNDRARKSCPMSRSRRSTPACCSAGWAASTLQDEWRITDNLTLNTGARFDQMWQYQNANQFSPRVSLTYKPFESTTFHAGFARTFHAAGAGDRRAQPTPPCTPAARLSSPTRTAPRSRRRPCLRPTIRPARAGERLRHRRRAEGAARARAWRRCLFENGEGP